MGSRAPTAQHFFVVPKQQGSERTHACSSWCPVCCPACAMSVQDRAEQCMCAVPQVAMCKALMEGVMSSLEFSWRMLLLPCW
jgi:hypothetical protein